MKKGFTLIEIMVAISIFAFVMTISAGSILSILDANAKSQALKSVMNNLNIALEGMSRSIRVGSNYHCGTGTYTVTADCLLGNSTFAFEPTNGNETSSSDQVVYRLNAGKIERSINGGTAFSPVTAPEVVVEQMSFFVRGSSSSDTAQPSVLLVVKGYAGTKDKIKTNFSIQTYVSQRLLDITP